MLCPDGHYPADFATACRLEDLFTMGDDRLHRIMNAYNLLPGGNRYNNALSYGQLAPCYGLQSPSSDRLNHLIVLFEFLAAGQVANGLRIRGRDPTFNLRLPECRHVRCW